MNNRKDTFEQIKHVLNTQQTGVLATQDDEQPYCSLMAYAESDDCKYIIVATMKNTHKYQNLKMRAGVSMLIDTRNSLIINTEDIYALTVMGSAAEIDADEYKVYREQYLQKHPYMNDFVDNPDCGFIVINVSKYILVQGINDVYEYVIE